MGDVSWTRWRRWAVRGFCEESGKGSLEAWLCWSGCSQPQAVCDTVGPMVVIPPCDARGLLQCRRPKLLNRSWTLYSLSVL